VAKVSVDHNSVGARFAFRGPHGDGATSVEEDFPHRLI
jgi:hypothetical protein